MASIRIDGSDIAFECHGGDTILRAALRAGHGFPYECNVGACGNCRFELLDGTVEHRRREAPAWSDRDRRRNRFLGCQSEPGTDCTIKVRLGRHYESTHRPVRRQARLAETEAVTHDITEFRFAIDGPAPFRPGQYALLEPPGIDGGRPYSMCNVSGDGGQWHFQVKRVPGGAATTVLFDRLATGEGIAIDGPYGMAYLREDAPRDLLCIAGGSGLSPMVSVARAAAASKALAGRKIHFLYGGRAMRDLCGESLLAELPGFGERLHYHAALSEADRSWTGRTGFIHEVAAELFGDRLGALEIYFAGPPAMAEATQRMLHESKVSPEQVHFDEFH